LEDLIVTLHAFEQINQVRVNIRLTSTKAKGISDIVILAEAWDTAGPELDPKYLGSVSVTCLATNLRTWPAALIHTMYLLDGKLAEDEFARVPTK